MPLQDDETNNVNSEAWREGESIVFLCILTMPELLYSSQSPSSFLHHSKTSMGIIAAN